MHVITVLFALFAPNIMLQQDATPNVLIVLRLVHLVAGITWLGLLYFFNLVNVPFLQQLDPPSRRTVVPLLMTRALWWFRWASVVTVFAGIWYWMIIVGTDKRNGLEQGFPASGGLAIGSFFLIWTVVSLLMVGIFSMGKLNDKPAVLGAIFTVLLVAAAYLYLSLNTHGWESNNLLSIGIGGGLGWVMMMNVWGVIWRAQKRLIQWTAEGVAPPNAAKLARMSYIASRVNFWMSFPMLFFMAAASHYLMFGVK
jgi:uncharacterized membrane protein